MIHFYKKATFLLTIQVYDIIVKYHFNFPDFTCQRTEKANIIAFGVLSKFKIVCFLMRLFLLKFLIFLLLIGLGIYSLACFADGETDAFYLRFTTGRQGSLITGTSRAAQGIIPSVLEQNLKKNKQRPSIFNFAFTNANSPYGQVYLKAIKKKLKVKPEKGLFILAVSPWSLSVDNNRKELREKGLFLDRLHFFNLNPNIDYLTYCYTGDNWGGFILPKKHTGMLLHQNGWLEILAIDITKTEDIQKRYQKGFSAYRNIVQHWSLSSQRIESLKETIEYCQQYGTVFLVRIPIPSEMQEIETHLCTNFDELIEQIAFDYKVDYFSFASQGNTFQYLDGNHLYKESAKRFSTILADSINQSIYKIID